VDEKDLLILKLLYNQDFDPTKRTVPKLSLSEIKNQIPGISAIGTIHDRITALEEAGFIEPPPVPNMPRSRRISQEGIELLERQGVLTHEQRKRDGTNWPPV
jgi:SOS-response transcriptional repressor LexA